MWERIFNKYKHYLLNTKIEFLILCVFCCSIYIGSYVVLTQEAEKKSIEELQKQVNTLDKEIGQKFEVLDTIAKLEMMGHEEIGFKQKAITINEKVPKEAGYQIGIANLDGKAYLREGQNVNIVDRHYFKEAIIGHKVVDGPVINKTDDKEYMIFAQPLLIQDKIEGIIYSAYSKEIVLPVLKQELMVSERIQVVLDNDNNAVYVKTNNNNVSLNSDSVDMQKLGEIEKVVKGTIEVREIKVGDESAFVISKPIQGTTWKLAFITLNSDLYKERNKSLGIIATFIIIISTIIYMQRLQQHKKKKRHRDDRDQAKNLMIIKINKQGRIIYCNTYALEQLQYKKEDIIGKNLLEVTILEDRSRLEVLLENKDEKLQIGSIDINFKTADYKKLYAICTIKYDEEHENKGEIEISAIDISQYDLSDADKSHINSLYEELASSEEEIQKKFEELCLKQEELERTQKRYSLVVETASMGVWEWDGIEDKFFYSKKWKEILGSTKHSEQIGNWQHYIHEDDTLRVMDAINRHINEKTNAYECECRMEREDSTYTWVHIIGKGLYNENNTLIRITGSMTDINQKKQHEEKMRHIAYFDDLTGMTNKNFIKERMNSICDHTTMMALIYMDIDDFKFINDSFGHEYGDWVLIETSKILGKLIRQDTLISRMNGDEFVALLTDIKSKEDINKFIEQVESKFEDTFNINDIKFTVSFSMGVALYPKDGENFEEILMSADIAMYKAKQKGKRKHVFFDKNFKETILEKVRVESNLRRAIKNEEFVLYYQPQLDIKTNLITGFEALIRWIDKDGKIIPPFKFIDIAEETGLIVPIGSWVMQEACTFLQKLSRQGYRSLYIAVNVSIIQLVQDNFVDMVERILADTKINPNLLHIEITETILMESIEANIEKIDRIKKLGVKLSLDDFGKGYSSLTYLKQLPINVLKIEKAFIDDINCDTKKNITASIINLGHNLELEVVAEGVETQDQMRYLKEHHCDLVQGYIISKPIPEQEVFNLINAYNDICTYKI